MRLPYIFFRKDGFYPVDGIKNDEEAKRQAEINPGTIRVERLNGKVVWTSPTAH